MELRRYAALLWRWAWMIALFTVLAGLVGFLVGVNTVPVYRSTTTLMVRTTAINGVQDYNSLYVIDRLSRTYARIMLSRPVMEKVVQNLGLKVSPEALAGQISVQVLRETQLLTVNVEDTDPNRAALIANETVKEFRVQNQDLQALNASEQTIQQELVKTQEAMARTQAQIDALNGRNSPADEAERNRLESLKAQYGSTYANLLRALEDLRLSQAQSANNLIVIETAKPEFTRIRPSITNNVLTSAFLGLLLGIGLTFLRDYLDVTVKSTEEVEDKLDSPPLGTVPVIEGSDHNKQLVTVYNPDSLSSETYRILQTNIELAEVDKPVKTLVITSGLPGEGKSLTVANLAVAMAQMGKNVIAVDTDLRKPSLHKYFGTSHRVGVTTAVLEPPGSITDHLVPTQIDNLRLLTSGPGTPNPAGLIKSHRMSELIEELKAEADIVLFDTPPLLGVADASLLAHICDATLLVVRAGATRKDILPKTREQLDQVGASLIGFVLNSVSARPSSYYHYYYYGQANTYSYGKEQPESGLQQQLRSWQRRLQSLFQKPSQANPAPIAASKKRNVNGYKPKVTVASAKREETSQDQLDQASS